MRLEWSAARAAIAVVAVVGLMGGGLAPAGAQSSAPPDCPEVMPVDQLHRGMTGTGWTVSQGTEPEQFSAEILGVLKDGIAPGRDLIIVDAHSPEIDRVGGIWYGMSGSPIYINDKLVGAISYGLSFGPSTVAGVTPAADMMDLFSYPKPSDQPAASPAPRTIPVPDEKRRAIAHETGTRRSEVGDDFHQLKLPLSISGLGGRAFARVAKMLKREKARFVPYAGSSASAQTTATSTDIHPGDNFAGAISYGDLTFAGVGTATIVCNGMVVSFGHPFDFTGEASIGANQADALAVVNDPVFGAYKLANVTDGLGTLDQDRLAGVRADLGEMPPLIPITSTITSEDNGKSRDGETDVVESDYVSFLAYYHVFLNILVAMDEYSEGSADVTWTINGTHADGSPWSFQRDNLYTSRYSIADEAPYELLSDLYALYYNDFEKVEFTSIDFDATVREDVRQYRLRGVEVGVNDGELHHTKELRVRPGDVLTIQETLHALTSEGEKNDDTSQDQVITQALQIPDDAKNSGTLTVTGGNSDYTSRICLYRPRRCNPDSEESLDSFDEYLAALAALPHNNDVLSRIFIGRKGKIAGTDVDTVDRAVSGRKFIELRLRGSRDKGVTSGGDASGGGGGKGK